MNHPAWHLQYGISSPVAVLAAASQRTRRIELGTAVIPLGWENPLRLAEDLATVDILSGGPADEIAEQLRAHAGFSEVNEVAFALPFTFEHEDYVHPMSHPIRSPVLPASICCHKKRRRLA